MVGGPVFAILIGMVIALWWKQPARGTVQDGIAFTAKKVLQYAVILLGFGLNLAQIAVVQDIGRREGAKVVDELAIGVEGFLHDHHENAFCLSASNAARRAAISALVRPAAAQL